MSRVAENFVTALSVLVVIVVLMCVHACVLVHSMRNSSGFAGTFGLGIDSLKLSSFTNALQQTF